MKDIEINYSSFKKKSGIMNVMKLEKGQSILYLRYSPSIKTDIIEQHKELIKKNGFVWYGKTGTVTSCKIIDEIFTALNPIIMLYSKPRTYICDIDDFCLNKPKEGYPSYYDDKYLCPSCYFRLKSIEPIDNCILNKLFIRSSKRSLADVLSKQCTSLCFFVSYEEIQELKSGKRNNENRKRNNNELECINLFNGTCRCKKINKLLSKMHVFFNM